MDYKGIPPHLIRHVSVTKEAYDSFDEVIKDIAIENATLKWKQNGSVHSESIIYIHEQQSNHQNYSYLLDVMYNFSVVHSIIKTMTH